MLFGFLTVVSYSTDKVSAQAEIVIVSSYISKTHVAVGEIVAVGFRLEWSSSGDPVSSAAVRINGDTYYITQDGWVLIQTTSDQVEKITWSVESIMVDWVQRSFEMDSANPSCVFDKVMVVIEAAYNRIGLGQTPEIYYDAYYEYDSQSFSGKVYVNDTVTSDVVGTAKIGVIKIEDDKYGINEFDANTVTIIWDRIDVNLFSSKQRHDLKEDPQLSYIAYYKYDLTPFEGAVHINSLIINTVGKYEVTVVSSIRDDKYDVRSFQSNSVELIFDQVLVDLSIYDTRIDVGDEIQAVWNAYYTYDNTSFHGDVKIGPDKRMFDVGSRKVTVTDISDLRFGLSSYVSNEVEVVWDRIRVDLSTRDERVNVGDTVEVSVDAYYEYDGEKIDETDVHLNGVSKRLTTVGDFTFRVESVDSKYGISSISTDDVEVIWDSIQFEIETPKERVILGSIEEPTVTAYYVYDGKPFRGPYELNRAFGTEIGPAEYYVANIIDDVYGITAFTSNRVEYYFDQLEVQSSISHLFPGSYQTTFGVTYVSDGSPVTNADIIVNGVRCSYVGNGVYRAEIRSVFPYVQSQASVIVDGYTVANVVFTSVLIGNVVVSVVFLGAGSLGLNKYILSAARKARMLEELREREEYKQRVVNEINRRSGIVSLDELSIDEVKPSLRIELINEALREGLIEGRLIKNDTKFVHQGFELELIRKKLIGS